MQRSAEGGAGDAKPPLVPPDAGGGARPADSATTQQPEPQVPLSLAPIALPPAPSAASLELELPLSPVVAQPLDGSRPFGAGPPASPTHATGDPPLRSGSSRQLLLLHSLRRPGTEVWVWGRGDMGQLGMGGTDDAHAPRLCEGLKGRDVVNLAAGALHTAAVTADGELYTCGSNEEGQLGVRRGGDALVPARVAGLEQFQCRQVACGGAHSLVLVDGAVAACGSAEFGQVMLGACGPRVELPRIVKDLGSMHVVRLAAGGAHSLALSATGGVFSSGGGAFGELGRGTAEGTDVPRPISALWPLGVVQVAAGEHHSAAVTADGAVLTWGRGRYGALGLGDFEHRSTPQVVQALRGVAARAVSCGDDHTVALAHDGAVYAWGRGTWGQTGLGHTDNVALPQRLHSLQGRRVVQVAAGGRHTLCLADDNTLWAFGSNDSGQLACPADCTQQLSARAVAGLPAGAVLFVAAGGAHSVAVVDRGASAQPGAVGPCTQRLHGDQWCAVEVPDLLQLAERAAARPGERAPLEDVMAGIESTFGSPGYLLASLAKRRRAAPAACAQQQQQQQQQPGGQAAAGAEDPAPMDASPPQHGADDTAAPVEAANGAATQQKQQQQQQQQEEAEPDTERVTAVYQSLLKLYAPEVVAALGNACVRLLDMLERFLNSMAQREREREQQAAQEAQQGQGQGQEQARPPAAAPDRLGWVAPVLFALLQSPLNGDPTFGSRLLLRISRVVSVTVPPRQRLAVRLHLTRLLSRLPGDALAARCVRPTQRYIDGCVRAGLGATRVQVMMAGVLVDVLRQASIDGGGILPHAEFANALLSEHANLQAEYVAWRQNQDGTALCSLCQMPYLLTPEAKSHILHGEAALQQQQHLSAAAMQAFFSGANPGAAAFLHIAVRRGHVVEDALNQLVHLGAQEVKKPLKVTFIGPGGVAEPAQDEGGVAKEFFQLLVRDLLRPDYGMFTCDEQTRTHWFAVASVESELEYALVGAALGLAIYNGVILDARFPPVAYKKLLGGTPDFADLRAAFPELARGLQALLDFDGDVEATFCRSFTAEYEFFGEVRQVELKPGGAGVPVTAANRREFVALYTAWLLGGSVERQFGAFRQGFLRVCGGPALTLFSPAELELLMCGLPHLDFDALRGAAKYEGGYTSEHQEVRWFWEVLRGFSLEEKRAFLAFTTGSDRAPIGGLGKLPLLIQRAGPDSDNLPTSHTCFNSLLLPEYGSRDKLRAKLLTAVQNAQGFGLQ